jgi:hypothetical protein
MTTAQKDLAVTVARLQAQVISLSRSAQLARSSLSIGGVEVPLGDAVAVGVDAGAAIPGLGGRLDDAAAAVEVAGAAADAAAIAAAKARTDALAAVADVDKALQGVDAKAIKAQADAADAAGKAAAADGKAVAAQNSADTAATKATNAANAASTADQKAVDAGNAASSAASAAKAADDKALAAAGLAGSKGKVIYATSGPTGDDRNAANLWINTSGGANTPNRWNGSAWVPVTDKVATDAAAAASTAAAAAKTADDKAVAAAQAASFAQSTADGKNSVTYSTAAPSSSTPGKAVSDLWFRRSGGSGSTIGIWEWTSGGIWEARTLNDQVIGNLDAGKITSGFIDAGRIRAQSITASMLAIGDFTNLADDGTFETTTTRNAFPGNTAFQYVNDPDGAHSGSWYFQLQEGAPAYTTRSIGPDFQVTEGDVIYLETWMRRDGATAAASLNLQILGPDKSSTVAFDLFAARGSVSATNGVWNKISGQVTVPKGGFWARPQLKHNGGAAAVGMWAWDDVIIRRASGGQLIVDGSIVTEKLAANSITAAKLVADIITARELAVDAVLARNIKAGEITAGKLAADSVTAVTIAAEAILARNIKAGEITAGKLAANSVTAANIIAGTITGDRIAANAITAREIKAGAITTDLLDANAINGMTITGALFRTAAVGKDRTESTASGFRFVASTGRENGSIQPDGSSDYRVLMKAFTASTIDQYEMRLGYQSWTGLDEASGSRAGWSITSEGYMPILYTGDMLNEKNGRSFLAGTWSGTRTSQDFSNGNRERAGVFNIVTAESQGIKTYGTTAPPWWMTMMSSGFQLAEGNYVITAKMTIAGTGIRATGRTFIDIVDQANPTGNLAHGPMPTGEDAMSVTWTGYTPSSRVFALWVLQTSGATRRINLDLSVTRV